MGYIIALSAIHQIEPPADTRVRYIITLVIVKISFLYDTFIATIFRIPYVLVSHMELRAVYDNGKDG